MEKTRTRFSCTIYVPTRFIPLPNNPGGEMKSSFANPHLSTPPPPTRKDRNSALLIFPPNPNPSSRGGSTLPPQTRSATPQPFQTCKFRNTPPSAPPHKKILAEMDFCGERRASSNRNPTSPPLSLKIPLFPRENKKFLQKSPPPQNPPPSAEISASPR